jgi:hypothetical protein
MRNPFKTTDIPSEIRVADPAAAEDFRDDFRMWRKAHVEDTRYWGGCADGRIADHGENGAAAQAR